MSEHNVYPTDLEDREREAAGGDGFDVPWSDLRRIYGWLRDNAFDNAADALRDVMESFDYDRPI